MGSGLCRRTGEKSRVDTFPGHRLLRRKIVFDYAKQWTRCSDNHLKCGEKFYTKQQQNKRSAQTKPVISGPFPADPDRLEGDKWRYVILTRLDTEPPPERPPRTRRRRSQQRPRRSDATVDDGGRRGSLRRRQSYGRDSAGRRRPARRDPAGRDLQRLSAAELMDMVSSVYRLRRPAGRSSPWPAVATANLVDGSGAPETTRSRDDSTRRNGFFESVDRCAALANGLLS